MKNLCMYCICLMAMGSLVMCKSEGGKQLTASGYEYVLHTHNTGPKIQNGEHAFFHVTLLASDSIVQTSRTGLGRPATLQIKEGDDYGGFKPVIEVLQRMSPGDSATLWFPMDSLPNRPPGFEGVQNLVYQIVLLEIKNQEQFNAFQQQEKEKQLAEQAEIQKQEADIAEFVRQVYADYQAGNLPGLVETPSGLKYIIHEEGDGPLAAKGQRVEAHYYGILAENGEMFDNSFKRGRTFAFALGQGGVIRGWDEGFSLLPVGSKATLFVPPALGYGKGGSPPSIPGDAELIFYVEFIRAN